jgi:DNA-binding LacI/PurR family transcriptional regulator
MQYRRSALARSIRRGYTNIIGFYSGFGTVSMDNPFIVEVFRGIQDGCNQYRKDLLIHGTFRGTSTDDIYDELTCGKIDGLVIFSPLDDNLIQRLRTDPLPVVAIAESVPGLPSIVMDDVDAGRQVARHLHARGHRHVVFRMPCSSFLGPAKRLKGLQQEAEALGMKVAVVQENNVPLFDLSEEERAIVLSKASDRPSAVVCWCDASASVFLKFLADHNVLVPNEIAVVGFDGFNLPFARGADLTTVVSPWAEVGRMAVSLLVDEESDKGGASLPVRLRVGDTT